jgi:hypothetical protein
MQIVKLIFALAAVLLSGCHQKRDAATPPASSQAQSSNSTLDTHFSLAIENPHPAAQSTLGLDELPNSIAGTNDKKIELQLKP